MQFSVQTLYALRALSVLGAHEGERPLTAREIADELEMSPDFLHQIMGQLKGAGIVHTKKGPHGGYRLERVPSRITLKEIVEVLEDRPLLAACTEPVQSDCVRIDECSTQTVLRRVSHEIDEILTGVTLADFCREETESRSVLFSSE